MIEQTEHQIKCPSCNWWIDKERPPGYVVEAGSKYDGVYVCPQCNYMISDEEIKKDAAEKLISEGDLLYKNGVYLGKKQTTFTPYEYLFVFMHPSGNHVKYYEWCDKKIYRYYWTDCKTDNIDIDTLRSLFAEKYYLKTNNIVEIMYIDNKLEEPDTKRTNQWI